MNKESFLEFDVVVISSNGKANPWPIAFITHFTCIVDGIRFGSCADNNVCVISDISTFQEILQEHLYLKKNDRFKLSFPLN